MAQTEVAKAILIGLAGFVIQTAQHVSTRCGEFAKDSQCAVRQFDGLRANGSQKIVMRKAARLIKDGFVEILPGGDHVALPCVVGPGVPLFKLGFVEVKLIENRGALAVVPAVGEKDSTDIEEDYVEGEHRRLWDC